MMSEKTDSAPSVPAQPAAQFLAAASALLVAIATNSTLDAADAELLLDSMDDADLREGLRVGLGEMGVLGFEYVRTIR